MTREVRIAEAEGMEEELQRLRQENKELREALKENAELRARINALEKLVESLQVALGLSSANSHRPPSTDSPKDKAVRNREKRQRKQRKRGPKHGHKGSHRRLLPLEDVTQ